MVRRVKKPTVVRGELTPPGDKSISHRAAILNSLAQGTAKVTNFAPGADCASTLTCLRRLGVKIAPVSANPPTIEVQGVGVKGYTEPDVVLDAGNSGTTMRLLTGLLAGQPFFTVITGDASLCSRPMGRVIHPLRLMGGRIYGRNRDTQFQCSLNGPLARAFLFSLVQNHLYQGFFCPIVDVGEDARSDLYEIRRQRPFIPLRKYLM